MGNLQQLLSQTVQQSMGLGDILRQKEQEAQMLGQALTNAAQIKANAQIKGQQSFHKSLQTGMENKAKIDIEQKKLDRIDAIASAETKVLGAKTVAELDALQPEIDKVTDPAVKKSLITAVNSRRNQIVTEQNRQETKADQLATKEDKKTEEVKKNTKDTIVVKIQGAKNNDEINKIVSETTQLGKSGKLTNEEISAINKEVERRWNKLNKKSKEDEIMNALGTPRG